MKLKIALASDHGGFQLKEKIKKYLEEQNYEYEDFGTNNEESVDYSDFASKVTESILAGNNDRGILICGTGIGMSIAANKVPGIRATLCHDEYTAKMSREHNDSNILVLGGRVLDKTKAKSIVDVWLKTEFTDEDRHARWLKKIEDIEKKVQNKFLNNKRP